ncbi:hypothetical protein T265_13184, partial [Opisthorchis viverrini]
PVTLWFEEHKLYTFAKVTDTNIKGTGHYTQVIWETTTNLGCHQHLCNPLIDGTGNNIGTMYFSLVVDQMAVDLFAELGNWLANVSSSYEETSSVRSWLSIILVDMVSTQHHASETLSPEKFRDLHNAFRKMILNGSVPDRRKCQFWFWTIS